MTKLKEKDIVNHLIANWNKFFPELNSAKKEFSFRNSRVDILSSFPVNLKDFGLRETDCFTNAAAFFEVKYNSNMRDLMFEIQKLVRFRDWYHDYGKCLSVVSVISDDFDYDMIKFFLENNVFMYKFSIEDDNLETLTLEEYNVSIKEIEEDVEIEVKT